jgi:glyoxylase-like metal-dependent hydrolase (beta-lactamase superfamily II)
VSASWERSIRAGCIAGVCAAVALAGEWASVRAAQGPALAGRVVPAPETLHVQGAVHLVDAAGTNVVVQVGQVGAVVVDPGPEALGASVRDAVRRLSTTPIRFLINTHFDPDHTGANEVLAASGAGLGSRNVTTVGSGQLGRPEIIAHQHVLDTMSGDSRVPAGAWPTATFSLDEKAIFVNGEAIQIVHQPAAHSDGDSLVFFRRSDVIAAGDLYSTESYPIIDAGRGGTIAGVLAALNRLLALAVSGEKVEGGTLIVPGHGRISDEADLVEYRDMVTIVRDRVQALLTKGQTLAQVQSARPTLEYDALYGSARGWSAEQFVEAVYRTSISKPRANEGGRR